MVDDVSGVASESRRPLEVCCQQRLANAHPGAREDPMTDPRDERFRTTVQARTADTGSSSTVIVTRQGFGRQARCWLTLNGSIRCTAVFTDEEAIELASALHGAVGRSTG